MQFEGSDYAVPVDMPLPKGVRIMRAGVKLGGISGKVWKPDHHLFCALRTDCVKNRFDCDFDTAIKFLAGEQIFADTDLRGYCQITYMDMPIGFGKASGGVIKNHLPKGLRINL